MSEKAQFPYGHKQLQVEHEDKKRGIFEPSEVKARPKKHFECKRLKGEHKFVEVTLPNQKHWHLENGWKVYFNKRDLYRWRLFKCEGCGKEELKYEKKVIE